MKRFRGRTASDKPLLAATTADDVLQLGAVGVPFKAEAFLGTKSKLGRKKVDKKARQQETFQHTPNVEHKSMGTLLRAQEALLDTQQSLLDRMPSSTHTRPRLQMWPNTETYAETHNRSANDLFHHDIYQPSQRPGIPPRRTSNNAVHDFYDPSRQPLYVSQQTSASAVRDMALHKGSPMIHETASDPALAKRPLKSALKKAQDPSRRPALLEVRTNSSDTKKSKRLDLSHFFPQPRAHTNQHLLSPNKLSRSPSPLTDTSEFFPQDTIQVQLKRPAANARLETHKSVKPTSADPDCSTRVKVFESDIFDQAKTNVRRPPKGIKNWFDGFDISSDEDEKVPEPEPQELPANEALPSVFSPWVVKPDSEQPQFHRKASIDPVEDNLLAIEAAKERMQERMRMATKRKGSVSSATIASVVSSEALGKKPPSRLSTSRLANESVLSLSDSSGDERARLSTIRASVDDYSAMFHDTAPMHVEKPTAAPRKLQSKRSVPQDSFPRQSTSTVQTTQTSASIPIRLADSIPLPVSIPLSPPAKGDEQYTFKNGAAQALRKLEGQRDSAGQPPQSRPTTKASAQDFESNATGETVSSMPTDASHMMAVTEEEMILLEMMRNKRAAMQKNSFTEGYQLALKREQEHLARRREGAQQTALNILRQKEERDKSQRGSRIAERPAEPDERVRRRYSAIKKEDVDKALKLQRFLAAAETPLEDAFPEPPTGTPVEEKRPPQKFELLLPDTYSPIRMGNCGGSSPISPGGSSPLPEEEDIEDHHHRVRQFLASSSASAEQTLFPTPPSAKSKTSSRRDTRRGFLSPSPVEEEAPLVPDVPERSPHRPFSPSEREERRSSISGRRLSCQIDIDQLLPRASALPAPLRQAAHNLQPYHLEPNLEFPPLDFPSRLTGASPSLSTSRASPLSPTFTTPAPSDRQTVEGASSSDNDQRSARSRAYTPDTDVTSLSAPTPRKRTAAKKQMPPKLDRILTNTLNIRGSTASITSAGEDVLAAWAELGGGTEALASRRRVR
ncbi:hypothetical protein LTR36_006008 [Oleoguttula mirabilis]|uniref:Uncharacterized protein n=1 Tax=Oleoguttula mirabilis TaxID=1507867 RepID=A0AAV9JD13_9PEZI|nr:hypothetical protein LTR36_006008 [Oleoguttula mirabilis]